MRDYVDSRWDSVPGCRVILDADVGVSLSAVTDEVTQWDDQAVGNDVTPSDDSPLYVANWRNGHGAIYSPDNGDRTLQRSAFLGGALTNPVTHFWVGDWSHEAAENVYSGVGTRQGIITDGSGGVTLFNGASSGITPTDGAPVIIRSIYRDGDSSVRVVENGAAVAENNELEPVDASSMNGVSVLNWHGTSDTYEEEFAYLLIIDHEPNASGLAEIETALSDKYDIHEA